MKPSRELTFMSIDPRAMIAGQPALKIRSLFRGGDSFSWNESLVADQLSISLKAARSVIQDLHQLGYIEQAPPSQWSVVENHAAGQCPGARLGYTTLQTRDG
jgi:hypothetical protein